MDAKQVIYGVGILLVLLGIFTAVVYGLKYLQSRVQNTGKLKLKENLFIDAKRRISVVDYDGKEFLVVFGAQQEHIIPIEERKVHETTYLQKVA